MFTKKIEEKTITSSFCDVTQHGTKRILIYLHGT